MNMNMNNLKVCDKNDAYVLTEYVIIQSRQFCILAMYLMALYHNCRMTK